jgi:hypothetical protein
MSIAVTKLVFNQTTVPATMVASATVMMAATQDETATQNVTATQNATATPADLPRLNAGKSIPGPDEWRALERRASSFRLR